jgi:dolichol-phosphate mannosyltransferase
MEISVVMTVYSETTLLVESIRQIRASLAGALHEILIVVHPKSNQECIDLCAQLEETPDTRVVVQGPNSGIGWAYREAIPHITGSHVLIMSSDLETNPFDATAMAREAQASGADIVCASRWVRGGGFSGYNPLKFALNYGYNLIFRTLYGTQIHDITFGYKLIRSEVLRHVNWEYGTHEFCAELLLRPLRLGYTATEVPSRWVKRPEGESKMTFARNFRFVSAAWKILRQPATPLGLSNDSSLKPETVYSK